MNLNPRRSLLEASKKIKDITEPFCDKYQPNFKSRLLKIINSRAKSCRRAFNKITKPELVDCKNKPLASVKTVIIYDWDDTLLCTSSLFSDGYDEDLSISRSVQETLTKLQDVVFKILEESIKQGKVYIITNSTEGWVQYSASKYMPRVSKLLGQISIVSARSNYEYKYPFNCNQWKMHAFMDTLKDIDTNTVTNLLAIGDSDVEIDASKHLFKNFPNAFLKTIKFHEFPTPNELIKQVSIIVEKFESI